MICGGPRGARAGKSGLYRRFGQIIESKLTNLNIFNALEVVLGSIYPFASGFTAMQVFATRHNGIWRLHGTGSNRRKVLNPFNFVNFEARICPKPDFGLLNALRGGP
jgi:hypothetical protein